MLTANVVSHNNLEAAVAAWTAAGCPTPNWQGKAQTVRTAPRPRDGVCALLGVPGPVFEARHCVSGLFTGWDRLPYRDLDPAGVAFSPPAAWALRLRVGMQRPHGLTADGVFREVAPSELHRILVSPHPLLLVSVPQSRQKHLVPWLQWSRVRVDDEALRWTPADRDRLVTYTTLRAAGFGESALAEPSPRWPVLSRLTDATRRDVLAVWPHLTVWRAHPSYLDVAARATRKDPM